MLEDKPRDTIQYLLGFFDVQSLCRSAQVCKKWQNVVNAKEVWADKLKDLSTYKPVDVHPKTTMQAIHELLKFDVYELSDAALKDSATYELILNTPLLASKFDGATLCELTTKYPDTLAILLNTPKLSAQIATSDYLYTLAKLNLACAKLILSKPALLTTISELLLATLIDNEKNIELVFSTPGLVSRIDHGVLEEIASKHIDKIQDLTQENNYKDLPSEDIEILKKTGYIASCSYHSTGQRL